MSVLTSLHAHSRCLLLSLVLLLAACSPVATSPTTPTPARPVTVSGRVFFDHNGNGAPDDGEPGIAGATIRVNGYVAVTAADGSYTLRDVPAGNQEAQVSAAGFRYLSLSAQAMQPIDQPVCLTVAADIPTHLGLTQGFLTLPFRCCPSFTVQAPFGMTVLFDVDRRVNHVRSYDPQHIRPDMMKPRARSGGPMVVTDQHEGIDYCFPIGTEIVAAAPGTVKRIAFNENAGHYVLIDHPYAGLQTLYAHLSQVTVAAGQAVARGQPIARSGDSGMAGEPHLHFGCYLAGDTASDPRDPYRDLTDPASQSHWTVDNDPQYPR